uniref:BCL2 interacting protein 2 n=1 Tax=Propithecus coquereli TaxID=379532 RepID=A0A2K6EVE3_PROCO
MEGVELKEEWQDEDFPIPLPEDDSIEADILAVTGPESQPDDLPKPKTTEVIRKGSITEYTAAEEKEDGRRWRMFRIGEQDHRVDMKAIEPYKKVISHGLRKNLKSLIIVHPSWFIRTLLAVTRPFISSKFSQKIRYVFNLAELAELVPMEYVGIPECIKQVDQELNGKQDEPKSEQ